ncbi:MAG: NAD(P)H-dependent oxidoreductase [Clostridia bacterium]|nr:NAD(P)H-dependent oxidoreductase [Clostridia bacterium]
MKKVLVAYFSASGVTRAAAEALAAAAQADLFEIKPETPYTAADLDWRNKQSRSTLEMQDVNCRPALAADEVDVSAYDAVFIGFPIWWGREPSVIDTFIEAHDFSGKCVIPFCTSGGGGFTNRAQIEKLLPGIAAHKELNKATTEAELKAWLCELSL